MFEKLKESISKFARLGVADKKSVEDLVKDIQRTLIQSDVNVSIVFELSSRIKEKALSENIPAGITRREHVIKIVYDELVGLLGKEKPTLEFKDRKILLLGLFGSGKTTTSAKLAKFYQKRGLSVGLISCDTWRPAAFEQLSTLASKINVPVYGNPKEKNPVKIVKEGLLALKGKSIIIVDSAGRSALDKNLADEIKNINKVLDAKEKILVLSGDIGQAAQKQAEEFNNLVGLTGIMLTKMDSSAKGGGAISACYASKVPVYFIGTGEKIDDIETYDPVRFVSRLLGMGDLEALLEKAKNAISPAKAEEMLSGDITLEAFYEQMESTKKMGSLDQIINMIPGMGSANIPKEALKVQEEKMHKWKFIIDSMTKKEKKNADIIDKHRIERIAKGSGTRPEDVRELIRHFTQTRKMIKKLKNGKMLRRGQFSNILKGFQGKMPF